MFNTRLENSLPKLKASFNLGAKIEALGSAKMFLTLPHPQTIFCLQVAP